MPEEVFKYTADLSQLKDEVDSATAKVEKLRESLENTFKKFGQGPQSTMTQHALDRAMAEMDKKIADLNKAQQQETKTDSQKPESEGGRNTSDKDLDRRYKRESLKYYRDFSATFGKTSKALSGGVLGLASGEGLGGFARGFSELGRHLMQTAGSKSFISSLTSGAAIGAVNKAAVASKVRATSAGGAGAAGETEVAAGVEEAVSVGAGIGILRAFAAIPGPIKYAIGAVIALGGADLKMMQLASSDVYGRTRRAGGFGTNVGQMTAFEDTMGRFVDPDSVLKSAQQAKFDITSPAYTAMKISGFNPEEWKDPTAMAEANIASAQADLKKWYAENPVTVLTKARIRGFAARGFSDEDIMRLAQGDQGEVNELLKKAQAAGPGLDIPDKQRKAWDDLITNITLAGDGVRKWGEDILSKEIPILDQFGKKIQEITGLIDPEQNKNVVGSDTTPYTKSPLSAILHPPANAIVAPETGQVTYKGGGGAPAPLRSRGRNVGSDDPSGADISGTGVLGSEIKTNMGDLKAVNPTDLAKIDNYLREGGVRDSAKTIAWCAAWVNAQLTHEGIKGTNSEAVSSFYRWGTSETGAQARRGDVMIMYGGRHVGRFTGERRGGLYGFYSGNASNPADPYNPSGIGIHHGYGQTKFQWVSPNEIDQFRRAPDPSAKTDKVSINNMDHFQGVNKQYAIKIDNPAGSSYTVAGGMLGATHGNYGNA
jgi:hypothetical protein